MSLLKIGNKDTKTMFDLKTVKTIKIQQRFVSLIKISNKDSKTMCKISSKLTIKTLEQTGKFI